MPMGDGDGHVMMNLSPLYTLFISLFLNKYQPNPRTILSHILEMGRQQMIRTLPHMQKYTTRFQTEFETYFTLNFDLFPFEK